MSSVRQDVSMSSGCLSLLLLYLSSACVAKVLRCPLFHPPCHTSQVCTCGRSHTAVISGHTAPLPLLPGQKGKRPWPKSVAEELLELSFWLFFRFHLAGFKVLCFKATKYTEGFDEKLGARIWNQCWLAPVRAVFWWYRELCELILKQMVCYLFSPNQIFQIVSQPIVCLSTKLFLVLTWKTLEKCWHETQEDLNLKNKQSKKQIFPLRLWWCFFCPCVQWKNKTKTHNQTFSMYKTSKDHHASLKLKQNQSNSLYGNIF